MIPSEMSTEELVAAERRIEYASNISSADRDVIRALADRLEAQAKAAEDAAAVIDDMRRDAFAARAEVTTRLFAVEQKAIEFAREHRGALPADKCRWQDVFGEECGMDEPCQMHTIPYRGQ